MRSWIEKGYGWPAGVVLLLLSSVSMMAMVVMAAKSDGGAQVVDNYYQKAVAWDSLATESARVADLGWTAAWTIGTQAAEHQIMVRDEEGMPVEGLSLDIRLQQPQFAEVQFTPEASWHADSGSYVFTTSPLSPGLWDALILVDTPTGAGRLDVRREVR